MDIREFWNAVLAQDENEIRKYFHKDAHINWHCTNERFTVDEFILANCEYPGDWAGTIERAEIMDGRIITAVHVYPKDKSASFHVTSFFETAGGKIASMDEYWADDGAPPQWRADMHLGTTIR